MSQNTALGLHIPKIFTLPQLADSNTYTLVLCVTDNLLKTLFYLFNKKYG